MKIKALFCTVFFFIYITSLSAQEVDTSKVNYYDQQVDIAWEQWDLEQVILNYQKLLYIYEASNNAIEVLRQSTGLATAYYYSNNLDSTRFYLDLPKVKNWIKSVPAKHISWSNYRNLQAVYAYQIGDYGMATQQFEQLLEIDLAKDTLDYEAIAIRLNNLGVLYDEIGDHIKAKNFLQQGLQYRRDTLQSYIHINTVEILNTLAYQYYIFKDFEIADSLYLEGLSTLKKLPTTTETQKLLNMICQNLSLSKEKQQEYSEAIYWLETTLKKEQNLTSKGQAVSYQLLSHVYKKTENYDQALELINKSCKLFKESYSHKHPRIGEVYENIGAIYAAKNQHEKALQFYQKGLTALSYEFNDSIQINKNPSLAHSINSKIKLLKVLQKKAKSLYSVQQYETALSTYQLASDLLDNMRLNYIAEESKYVLLERARAVYEGAIETALVLERVDLAWEWSERSKAVLLLENIKKINAANSAMLSDSLLQQEVDWKVQMAYEERQLLDAQRKNQERAIDSIQNKLFHIRRNYYQFLEDLEQKNNQYYRLKYNTEVSSIASVQKQILAKGELLLEFFEGDSSIFIFALTKKQVEVVQIKDLEEISSLVKTLMKQISQPSSLKEDFIEFTQVSHQLYQALLIPILARFSEPFHFFLIIPDGALSSLPFQVLLKESVDIKQYKEPRYDTLNYLFNQIVIDYGFSTTLILEQSIDKRAAKSLNFGGFAPVFTADYVSKRRSATLGELPNSKEEILAIQELIGGDTYVATAANKAVFLDYISSYNLLHLATHASLNDNEPNDSRIYLHDDYLNTKEIYNLPLSAELVVLSACETGTGLLQKGEGLMSLARAFTYANCPSLLTSLWKVDDKSTTQLMIGFYEHIKEGACKDIALQQTQMAYLKSPLLSYERKHPFFWAGFILLGNDDAIVARFNWNYVWLTSSVFLLLLLFLYKKR